MQTSQRGKFVSPQLLELIEKHRQKETPKQDDKTGPETNVGEGR